MARVMRRVVDRRRVRETHCEDETDSENECEAGCYQRPRPFAASDDNCRVNVSIQLSLLGHPSGAI